MKYKKQILITLLFIVIVFVFTYGITFAKYVANSVWDYHLRSNGFYFYSDDLEISPKETTISKWDGEKISLNLKNYQNSSIITDYDINYTIECEIEGSSNAECRLNGKETSTDTGVLSAYQSCQNNTEDGVNVSTFSKSECEIGNYTWNKETVVKDFYFEIISTNPSIPLTDVKVIVTVKSTSPYNKTISGVYNLTKLNPIVEESDEIVYTYDDYGIYGRLTITNRTTNASYESIGWSDSTFLMDEKVTNLESYTTTYTGYLNRATILVPRGDSKSFIFYKKNKDQITTIDDFTIGKGIPNYLPSYVAGVYQGDETNLYVGNLTWKNDRLLLNGVDQGIEIYDNDADYTGGITLIVYFNRIVGNSGVQNLIMKRSINTNGYFMYINGANDVVIIDIGGASNRFTTPIVVEDGLDYHIVYSWDPVTKGKLYKNGVLIGTSSLGDENLLSAAGYTPIKVGFDKDGVYGGNKYPYWGEIKAMNVYNAALTQEEVWDIYQRDISFN